MERDGIQGVILCCTELPMLIQKEDVAIPIFNTTENHVNKIVDRILMDEECWGTHSIKNEKQVGEQLTSPLALLLV